MNCSFRVPVFALLLVAVALQACDKDNEVDGSSAADISFRVDTSYAYQNDTVSAGDTLLVQMAAAEGTDELETFLLGVSYDGAPIIGKDTTAINQNPYLYEATIVTRPVAGTEKWSFTVEEPDGDRTTRSLTFVTVE